MGVVLSNNESLLAGLCSSLDLLKLHNKYDDVFLREKCILNFKLFYEMSYPLLLTQRGGALVPNHTYYTCCRLWT